MSRLRTFRAPFALLALACVTVAVLQGCGSGKAPDFPH